MGKLSAALLVCLACTGADGRSGPSTESPEPGRPTLAVDPAQRAEIERDLAVLLTYGGPRQVEADSTWPTAATLVNRGERERWLVRPNDGSDQGWREPHVFYSAEMESAPGVWQPVPLRDDLSRCGNYATDWYSDVTSLAPGAAMKLEWMDDPGRSFDFGASGHVRLYAHYEYDGGAKRSFQDSSHPVDPPRQLDGLGAFAVVSAPLELDVHVDTSIRVSMTLRRRTFRVGEGVPFAALADVTVENVSSVPVELTSGPGAVDDSFFLEVADSDGYWRALPSSFEAPPVLEPHTRTAVRAPADAIVARAVPCHARMRMRFDSGYTRPDGSFAERRARSPWVEFDVVP